jgi:thiol-disulfide isomerase/thioredoxin
MKKYRLVSSIFILCSSLFIGLLIFGLPVKKAPNSQLILLDGNQKVMDDFLGKVLLVNFWATSCTTCVAEMPDLVAIHEKFESQGFEIIAVAMQYDPPSYVVNFTKYREGLGKYSNHSNNIYHQ